MVVQIKYHHMPEKKELTEHIEQRLKLALDRFDKRIRRVVMNVHDMNGPKGGVDKRCLAVVELQPRGIVAFEHTDTDAFTVVALVAGRLKERLRRRFGKKRARRHQGTELPEAA